MIIPNPGKDRVRMFSLNHRGGPALEYLSRVPGKRMRKSLHHRNSGEDRSVATATRQYYIRARLQCFLERFDSRHCHDVGAALEEWLVYLRCVLKRLDFSGMIQFFKIGAGWFALNKPQTKMKPMLLCNLFYYLAHLI